MGAVLIDLDGTLADSLLALRTVFESFVRELGGSAANHPFERFNGPPLEQIVETLRQDLAPTRRQADLLDAYCAAVDQAYAEITPCPGAAGFLTAAKAAGWRVIVVTSNGRRRAAAWLERTGLAKFIDGMVSGDEVPRGKPWPDPYLAALRLAGAEPDQAVAIEDSAQGARAACEAGVRVIAYHPVGRAPCDWPSGVTVCQDYQAVGRAVEFSTYRSITGRLPT